MKKGLVLGSAALVLMVGTNLYAGDLTIGGYADITTTLSKSSDPTKENKTWVMGEVDFEKTTGQTTVRVDLDFPEGTHNAKGVGGAMDTVGEIEQAKFVRDYGNGSSLTGGAFNVHLGFEREDSPEMLGASNGQLFKYVPQNLAGLQWSWAKGATAVDLFYGNDWQGQASAPTGYDNSWGGHASFHGGHADLSVSYITSGRTPTGPAPKGNGDVLDVVLSGQGSAGLLALEVLSDDIHDGWGITANHTHDKHGIMLRYDTVETAPAGGTKTEKTSLTAAVSCAMWDNVRSILEWKQEEMGTDTSDVVALKWVATF